MQSITKRFLMLLALAGIVIILSASAFAADTEAAATDEIDIKELADQVDVLQLTADLKLKDDQIKFIIARIESLKQKKADTDKREKALLLEIKEPLQKMKEYLVAGKEVPAETQATAFSKLKSIIQTRQDMQQSLVSAADSCVQMLDAGQLRMLTRTPDVLSRASKMVQQIQNTYENNWPQTMAALTAELLDIKQIDRYQDWQTQMDKIQALPDQERDRAYQDFESQRQNEVAQMKMQVEQLLMSIRQANRQVLPIAVNNLASALKSQTEVHSQAFGIMSRILDNPAAPAALKAKLEAKKETEEKSTSK